MSINYNNLYLGLSVWGSGGGSRELACAIWENDDNRMLPKLFFECEWRSKKMKSEVLIGQLSSTSQPYYLYQYKNSLIVKDTDGNVISMIMVEYKWSITHSIDMSVFDQDKINFATFEIRGRLVNRTDIWALVLDGPRIKLYNDNEYGQKLTSIGFGNDLYKENELYNWINEDRLDSRPSWMSSFLRLFNAEPLTHTKKEFFGRKPTTDLPLLLNDELLPSDVSDNRKLSILIADLFARVFIVK